MNKVIFSGFGVDVIKKDEGYYIRYDAGTIAMIDKVSEITQEESI